MTTLREAVQWAQENNFSLHLKTNRWSSKVEFYFIRLVGSSSVVISPRLEDGPDEWRKLVEEAVVGEINRLSKPTDRSSEIEQLNKLMEEFDA